MQGDPVVHGDGDEHTSEGQTQNNPQALQVEGEGARTLPDRLMSSGVPTLMPHKIPVSRVCPALTMSITTSSLILDHFTCSS